MPGPPPLLFMPAVRCSCHPEIATPLRPAPPAQALSDSLRTPHHRGEATACAATLFARGPMRAQLRPEGRTPLAAIRELAEAGPRAASNIQPPPRPCSDLKTAGESRRRGAMGRGGSISRTFRGNPTPQACTFDFGFRGFIESLDYAGNQTTRNISDLPGGPAATRRGGRPGRVCLYAPPKASAGPIQEMSA